jgi:hypothetical protein
MKATVSGGRVFYHANGVCTFTKLLLNFWEMDSKEFTERNYEADVTRHGYQSLNISLSQLCTYVLASQ